MSRRQQDLLNTVATVFDRLGIIAVERFRPTIELAWPRVITGFSMMSKQTADLAMVGIAVGTAGTAGLAFAMAYWRVVMLLGLGLAGGTISLVSQNYGGDDNTRASLAIRQSVLVSIGFAIPITAAFVVIPGSLIGFLGADAESLRHGITYLTYVAPSVAFAFFNLIASRTYTGVGDSFTEMVARAGGAVLNIVLSALFIFGFGMGVVGAGLGTALAEILVTVVLGWGMIGRSYGVLGMEPNPVPITQSGRWLDTELFRQLVEISMPEIGRRLAAGMIIFPLLWVAASFGPVIVTALEVARRVRRMINSVNWGLGLASSSLVGQHLGAGEEAEANAYGASIIRLALVLHIGLTALVLVFATQIAGIFVSGSTEVAQTAVFVTIGAISSIGFGINGTASGALLGAGYTRWPFVSELVGRYVIALPVAALGILTPLGISSLYLALLFETYVPGVINYGLFRSGRWKAVSRRYRPSADPE